MAARQDWVGDAPLDWPRERRQLLAQQVPECRKRAGATWRRTRLPRSGSDRPRYSAAARRHHGNRREIISGATRRTSADQPVVPSDVHVSTTSTTADTTARHTPIAWTDSDCPATPPAAGQVAALRRCRLHKSIVNRYANVGTQVGARAAQLVDQLTRRGIVPPCRSGREHSNDTPLTTNTWSLITTAIRRSHDHWSFALRERRLFENDFRRRHAAHQIAGRMIGILRLVAGIDGRKLATILSPSLWGARNSTRRIF